MSTELSTVLYQYLQQLLPHCTITTEDMPYLNSLYIVAAIPLKNNQNYECFRLYLTTDNNLRFLKTHPNNWRETFLELDLNDPNFFTYFDATAKVLAGAP